MNTKNIYYRLIILLLLIQVQAAAQTLPILPSPDFAVAHNATISGTVTTDETNGVLPGILAKLIRIGSPDVPVSFALTDMNGDYTLTGNAGIEYRVEFEFPSSGFSSAIGNPSASFTAVEGEQSETYDLELTRSTNSVTNCNVTPEALTTWSVPSLLVDKPTVTNEGAVLQNVEVSSFTTAKHPIVTVTAGGAASSVGLLETGANVVIRGPGNQPNIAATTAKIFANSDGFEGDPLLLDANESLTYYNISSGAKNSVTYGSNPPTDYLGEGSVSFFVGANGRNVIGTQGGNSAAEFQTNAAAGVCITYTYSSDPLPVKLISFTADADSENNVAVQWNTSEEANASHFEVEHSADSKQWTSIAKVNAANQNQSSYRFTHYNAPAGLNFYRLKNVDFDGTSELSKIVSVRVSSLLAQGRIYPNPASASDNLTLDFAESNITDVTVFDLSGRQLSRQQPSDNLIQLTGLQNGLYLLKLADTQGRIIHKTLLVQ